MAAHFLVAVVLSLLAVDAAKLKCDLDNPRVFDCIRNNPCADNEKCFVIKGAVNCICTRNLNPFTEDPTVEPTTLPTPTCPSCPSCPTTPQSTCRDNAENCASYKTLCENPAYKQGLKRNCARTCGYC